MADDLQQRIRIARARLKAQEGPSQPLETPISEGGATTPQAPPEIALPRPAAPSVKATPEVPAEGAGEGFVDLPAPDYWRDALPKTRKGLELKVWQAADAAGVKRLPRRAYQTMLLQAEDDEAQGVVFAPLDFWNTAVEQLHGTLASLTPGLPKGAGARIVGRTSDLTKETATAAQDLPTWMQGPVTAAAATVEMLGDPISIMGIPKIPGAIRAMKGEMAAAKAARIAAEEAPGRAGALAEIAKAQVKGLEAARPTAVEEAATDLDTITSLGKSTELTTALTGMSPKEASDALADTATRAMSWLQGGKAGFIGGKQFANARFTYRGEMGNIAEIASSEAQKVTRAFQPPGGIAEWRAKDARLNRMEAMAGGTPDAEREVAGTGPTLFSAILDNLYHGIPVPEKFKGPEYAEGYAALRRSLSDLSALGQELETFSPEVLDEYPLWVKRLFDANKKGGSLGPAPGLAKVYQRKDAWAANTGIPFEDAQELLKKLPKEFQPFQPAAPGMSKGLVEATPSGTLIKWPETEAGRKGRMQFQFNLADDVFKEELAKMPAPAPSTLSLEEFKAGAGKWKAGVMTQEGTFVTGVDHGHAALLAEESGLTLPENLGASAGWKVGNEVVLEQEMLAAKKAGAHDTPEAVYEILKKRGALVKKPAPKMSFTEWRRKNHPLKFGESHTPAQKAQLHAEYEKYSQPEMPGQGWWEAADENARNMLRDKVSAKVNRLMGEVTDPIPSPEAISGMEMDEAADMPKRIDDLYAVLRRSWTEVLRRRSNEALFKKIVDMQDDLGNPLTQFVSVKDIKQELVPEGYVVMGSGYGDKKWGALTHASMEGAPGETIKGVYAVKQEVAEYLSELRKNGGETARFFHGALDRWAINAINAPRTGLMNALYNVMKVDTINGTSYLTADGRALNARARAMVREWETTGVAPVEVREILMRGGDLRAPFQGLADIFDSEAVMFEGHHLSKDPSYEAGSRFVDWLSGSPLAPQKAATTVGGALGGAAIGAAAAPEGETGEWAAGGALLGATAGLATRPLSRKMMAWYGRSDQRTKIAAALKYFKEATTKGLKEKEAWDFAVENMSRKTQNYSRLGGVSEALSGSPSEIIGVERTGVRAIQKGFLNRFAKFKEADLRLTYEGAFDPDWRVRARTWTYASAALAAKYAALPAAVAAGLLSKEDGDLISKARDGTFVVPVGTNEDGSPKVATIQMEGIMPSPVEVPTSIPDAMRVIPGPATQAAWELGSSVFTDEPVGVTGIPVRQQKTVGGPQGEKETEGEALWRSNLSRWLAPMTVGGRVGQTLARLGSEKRTGSEEQTPVTVAASALIGSTRVADPAQMRDRLVAEWASRSGDIMSEGRAEGRAAPGQEAKITGNNLRRLTDLAREMLDKGLPKEVIPAEILAAIEQEGSWKKWIPGR